jgi:N-sulfoglucosamine sulfohydrolase
MTPLCLLLTLVFLTTSFAAEKNIIFFIADDLGDTLGCYGNSVVKTPNIDALAKDGVLFQQAYATTASCSASRSVIMTGIHNHANGQYGHTQHENHFSCFYSIAPLALPHVMRAQGYRTGLFGKNHVAPSCVIDYDVEISERGRNTHKLVDSAKSFILEKDSRPFLAYIACSDPHRGSKLEPHNLLAPDTFGNLPPNEHYQGIQEVIYDPTSLPIPAFLPDTPECRAELTHYYQSVSRVDSGVGHLISFLKENQLYDKTLIIFTSDHGMAFAGGKTTVYEPGLKVPMIVRNPYQPKKVDTLSAFVSHTDITPTLLDFAGGLDHKKNAPKQTLDLKKFYAQHHLKPQDNSNNSPKSYHGHSWLNLLEGQSDPARNEIYASHTFHEIQMYYPMRTIRDAQYKLIWNIAHRLDYPFASDLWVSSTWQAQLQKGPQAPYGKRTVDEYLHRPAFELYDLNQDPNEIKNLANDPQYQSILKQYQSKIKTFQETTMDPWVLKWKYE